MICRPSHALYQQMGPYLAQPSKQKTKFHSESTKLGLKFSRCEMQGWRRTMEDAAISELDLGDRNSVFAVFDGHGGPQVALFAQKYFLSFLKTSKFYKEAKYKDALIETFRKLDEAIDCKLGEQQLKSIRKKSDSTSFNDGSVGMGTGCTACVVLITPDKIFTANAGDSRAVLSRGGKAVPLSFDHKPTNQGELKRIQAAGGTVLNGRINGTLNLSRSLGDLSFKRQKNRSVDDQLVISRPDVTEIPRCSEDEFIFLGCDGVWERYVKDSQLMVSRIAAEKKTQGDGVGLLSALLDSFLAEDTQCESGCDNMTVILVEFLQ